MTHDAIDLLKWVLGSMGGAVLFALTLTWRAANRAGKLDHELGLLAQIKDRTDRIPQLEQTIALLVEQQKKLTSQFPKAVHSLDRRVSKLEWMSDVEPTGKYTLPTNGESE